MMQALARVGIAKNRKQTRLGTLSRCWAGIARSYRQEFAYAKEEIMRPPQMPLRAGDLEPKVQVGGLAVSKAFRSWRTCTQTISALPAQGR